MSDAPSSPTSASPSSSSEPSADSSTDAGGSIGGPVAASSGGRAVVSPIAAAPALTEDDAVDSPFAYMRGGHALRLVRGGLTFVVGFVGAFLLMANELQLRWGVPLGFLFVVVASIGAMDFFGTFDDATPWTWRKPDEPWLGRADKRTTLPPATVVDGTFPASKALVPALATLVSVLSAMAIMSMAGGVTWGIAAGIGWIATCWFGFKTLAAVGLVDDVNRPIQSREGFWLIVFCVVLFLPTLGAHSLVDPWETHYGEVSREVLSRDDWITIWWAEEGYFTSKPILDFWMQAIAMATMGVSYVAAKHAYLPDQVLAPSTIHGNPPHPEWVVRLPSLTLSVIALYLAYRAIAQVRGRRAGLLSAMVLATMADWSMLAHESITDMPFVASLTITMSLLMLGLTTDDDKTVRAVPVRFGKRVWSLSGFHLATGIVLVFALPQVFYLMSRNLTLMSHDGPFAGWGFLGHKDSYHAGEGHKCWINPSSAETYDALLRIGKWACDPGAYAHPEFQPALQGLLWLAAIGLFLFINKNERRFSRLCFNVAWVFAAVASLGKGFAGFLLPIAVVGLYILTANKWRDVLRLQIGSGLLIMATVGAPWWIAMYVRMGDEFVQQLIIHHQFKRTLDHVHDTNTGDDVSLRYYVWQLGYAFFPWTGVVAAGLVWWARARWEKLGRALTITEERQRDVTTFLVMWFVLAWGLFTFMKTKFHHYVFPAVPPAAMLTGIFLDEALGDRAILPSKNRLAWGAWVIVGTGAMAFGLSLLVPGPFFGHLDLPAGKLPSAYSATEMLTFLDEHYHASPLLGALLATAGLFVALMAGRLSGNGADDDAASTPSDAMAEGATGSAKSGFRPVDLMIGAAALAGAFGTAIVTRDLASRPDADIKGQERFIQLYTYRYDRVWPKDVYLSSAFFGFGVAAIVLLAVIVARAYRRQAIVAFASLAALCSAWTLDVYMVRVAPHWGQRPLFEAYYRDRNTTEEPLVAFEMNWKGENFYSGGGLVEFGNSMGQGSTASERASDRMREWLTKMKTKTHAAYFVTEKNRVSKIDDMLKGVLGAPPGRARWTEDVTSEIDDNKFILVRVRFPG